MWRRKEKKMPQISRRYRWPNIDIEPSNLKSVRVCACVCVRACARARMSVCMRLRKERAREREIKKTRGNALRMEWWFFLWWSGGVNVGV